MKLKMMAILAIWMSTAFTLVKAQSPAPSPKYNISGKIIDEAKAPFDLANVGLFNAKDSSLVKSTYTEQDGKFVFDNLSDGVYQVRISAMGFKNYRTENLIINGKSVVLADVTLLSASKQLNEVSIVGKKALIERKIDRTVVNVDALVANAGSSAMEVLEKSPGVMVDQNGAISLKGKQGVTIFIDDKPTYLSGTDLENYLKSIPSSSIDQIELMTNPPAKYDAAGNAGIINIKTKKGAMRGFNGAVNLGYTQGKLPKSNNSFNFNYRDNKLNVFGNVSYAYNKNFTDLDLFRRYKNEDGSTKSFFEQNSYMDRKSNAVNGKIGADYYQSDKNTFGIVLTGATNNSSRITDNVSNLLNANRGLDSVVKALSDDNQKFKNMGVNLNFRRQIDKNGHELSFDADYLNYNSNNDQKINYSAFLPDNTQKYMEVLNGRLPSDINIYTAKVDYSRPLTHGWKLDAGAKTSYTKTDNTADYSNTILGTTKPDYDKSNHFLYKENINAGYLNMSREGKRLSVQLGLRLENTVSDGHQLGNIVKPDSAFRRSYTDLFPTVYVSYKLDTVGNNQIDINYGRRVDRPYFQDLNPFISPLDKFTYYVGNPFLNPSFTNSIELSHTYKGKITTSLKYSKTKDDVNETIQILDDVYYSRPGNLGSKTSFGASVSAGINLTSWLTWQSYEELTYLHAKSMLYTEVLDSKGSFLYTNNTFQFKIGSTWTVESGVMYRTRIRDAQFVIGSLHMFNAGVQKKLSPSTTLKISGNDIFNNRIINGQINNLANTEAGWRNRGDSRTVAFSLSYRFGKTIAGQRKHDSSGADAEKNRVK